MTNLTAQALTSIFNDLTGKNIKATSYPKAKLISMIDEVHPTPGFYTCPHCGIDHIANGYQDHDSLTADGLPGLTTNRYICLACNGEFGPELHTAAPTETFTMAQAAAAAGVTSKAARARYRATDNDGVRTRYVFDSNRWDEVIAIISPKR